MAELLRVEDLSKVFELRKTSLFSPRPTLTALDHVTLKVDENETFGVVGESGSGKTTLVKILLGLETPTSGSVHFDGKRVLGSGKSDLRQLRRGVQVVMQDPTDAMDGRMDVFDIVAEPLRAFRMRVNIKARVEELLDAVGMPAGSAGRKPHEFSGGQRQRIAIARALAPRPRLLIADEPVSALDVSIRAQILNLLTDLKESQGLTLLLVAHDLDIVRHACERVAVMQRGIVVEQGATDQVFGNAQHSYTKSLLAAVPRMPKRAEGEGARQSARAGTS
ncbi:ATP-binding cassette domain-containing protein [Diaminobutyricimonas sp. LJ205]|uniref:ATP-binding cassette domain-containing protein n=1 Tax=Diaminobutyricimonas sp. LJ205 TaxID=2683590 RepID=UPI0012F49E67|nr:ATP-binding cassette domain-containing protein [Diaminobutyricimonas sp. LJ205]